jgi:hypothetical protein
MKGVLHKRAQKEADEECEWREALGTELCGRQGT